MSQIDLHNKTVIISRTDSIGDVMLTLPLCSWIKEKFPSCKLIFLGRNYTRPVLECYPFIDRIECWNDYEKLSTETQIKFIRSINPDVFIHVFPNKQIARVVKKANVDIRIGTSHRLFHTFTCNIRPNFTRKNSPLHESQLNFELLRNLGLKNIPSLAELKERMHTFRPSQELADSFRKTFHSDRKKIILHPKSQGSAVEWPLEKFIELSLHLAKRNHQVYFSGTEKEGLMFRNKLPKHENIHDISGRMTLDEFIAFIAHTDALVACSTGPLHIAAALGKRALGLYSNKRPIHPGRWAPLGKNTAIITNENKERLSQKISPAKEISEISVQQVIENLTSL